MGFLSALNSKPITVVGVITAVHSIVYGLGFLFALGGFEDTVLFKNLEMIGSPTYFGLAILLSGVLVIAGLVVGNARLIAWFSTLQSLAWLFTFLLYVLNGQVLLGIGVAFVWTLLSSYVAYLHANQGYILGAALKNYQNDTLKH